LAKWLTLGRQILTIKLNIMSKVVSELGKSRAHMAFFKENSLHMREVVLHQKEWTLDKFNEWVYDFVKITYPYVKFDFIDGYMNCVNGFLDDEIMFRVFIVALEELLNEKDISYMNTELKRNEAVYHKVGSVICSYDWIFKKPHVDFFESKGYFVEDKDVAGKTYSVISKSVD